MSTPPRKCCTSLLLNDVSLAGSGTDIGKRVTHQRQQAQNSPGEGSQQAQVQRRGYLGLNLIIEGFGVALGDIFQNAEIGRRAPVVLQVLVGIGNNLAKLWRSIPGDEGIILNGEVLIRVGGGVGDGLHGYRARRWVHGLHPRRKLAVAQEHQRLPGHQRQDEEDFN